MGADFQVRVMKNIFFFSFFATQQHMAVPGQESEPSRGHNRGRASSLSHSARVGIEPASWCSRATANPVAPPWELWKGFGRIVMAAQHSECN